MEVAPDGDMGPERILPNSADDEGQERPVDGGVLEEWSGEDTEDDVGGGGDETGDGYYYQPLNQEPDGTNNNSDEGTTAEQLQDVQERIEAMGLFLPHPPPPDSDEEADSEEAAARRSHASIPMDPDHVELVKRTMAAVNLPTVGVPAWAEDISDEQWKDMVQQTLQSRQSSAGLRLERN